MTVPNTYQHAGVSIQRGDEFVQAIKPLAASTPQRGVMGGLGGFGALFDFAELGFQDPILVSTTDGVGSKVQLASQLDMHSTIGMDLVSMCVNDLVVQGARPLMFLDYLATHRLQTDVATQVVKGIATGCQLSNCALMGGETAEMPTMYATNHYDLAGFAVGMVERTSILPRHIEPGDTLIGLQSSGLHSNGFSLVHKVLRENSVNLQDAFPCWHNHTVGQRLLTPTRNYVGVMLRLCELGLIKGAAHITGGGIAGNLVRILPPHTQAVIDRPWIMPSVFAWLKKLGNISTDEMFDVFNCGIGMILVTAQPGAVRDCLRQECEMAVPLGTIQPGPPQPIVDLQAIKEKVATSWY
jgi:phosphoribosylformylglycinamidine cyclo-ligase